ncbi:asparagine synthetase B [Vibrio breoganii]
MCGFFITNDPRIDETYENIIEETLRFRGPDCSSGLIAFSNGWSAYHSRLSIIDLSSGVNQPVYEEHGGLLVFNGEILNYKSLGYKYFNKEYFSDTLLLSDLLVTKQLNFLELDGFFSFVYVNSEGKLEKAARDPFGVKPLFYYENNGYFSFSSEPSTLKEIYKLDVNQLAISEYKAIRAPIFSNTFFCGVEIVEPGSCLVNGTYFDCKDYLKENYSEVNIDLVKGKILDGINSRVVSDAPVGLLLSRGIDSHLLKNLSQIERYYSIGFKGDGDYEYLAEQEYENLKLISVKPEEYRKDFEFLLSLRKEPMSVPNEVLLYRVAKEAKNEGIKVLLSGEGADEFFAGYDRVFQWGKNEINFNLKDFLRLYCYSMPEEEGHVYKEFKRLFEQVAEMSCFEQVRWFFVRYHMPILFRRLDFALMAAGVEGREPLANIHTFMVSISLSPDDLMGEKLGKLPLRELIEPYEGSNFAYEDKIGFPVDLTKIFKNTKNLNSYELWFEKNLEVLER